MGLCWDGAPLLIQVKHTCGGSIHYPIKAPVKENKHVIMSRTQVNLFSKCWALYS